MIWVRRLWPPIIVFILCAAAMQIWARKLDEPYLLPTPTSVWSALWQPDSGWGAALWTTTESSLIGFFASAIFGIIAAVILSASNLARRAFYPYTVFFQTVPIIAIAPLLMIWFDAGLKSVSICAFIVSVFPVIANTMTGILSVDPALNDLFRLYGAGAWARLWKLKLPSAIPDIMTGLRIAGGLAVIGAVVGEFFVGTLVENEGLGVKIMSANKMGHTDEVFAGVIISSLLGLILFAAVNLAARLLLRNWHASEKDTP